MTTAPERIHGWQDSQLSIASATVDALRKLVDADLAARKQGEKQ